MLLINSKQELYNIFLLCGKNRRGVYIHVEMYMPPFDKADLKYLTNVLEGKKKVYFSLSIASGPRP